MLSRTCTSWLIMRLCQLASQRNSLVVLQLRLRIELPSSEMHPCTIATLETRVFAVTGRWLHVCLFFYLILLRCSFQVAYFGLWLVPMPVVSVGVMSPSPVTKHFCSGRMASHDLPLSRHRQTHILIPFTPACKVSSILLFISTMDDVGY